MGWNTVLFIHVLLGKVLLVLVLILGRPRRGMLVVAEDLPGTLDRVTLLFLLGEGHIGEGIDLGLKLFLDVLDKRICDLVFSMH